MSLDAGLPTMVIGDFNLDFNITPTLVQHLMLNNISYHIKSSTTDYCSCLDQVCTFNWSGLKITCNVLESYYSDHKPVVATLEKYNLES